MPFAKDVSAVSYAFNKLGMQTTIEYSKMLKIVKDTGLDGYIGIEYDGDELSEIDGIRASKELLKSIADSIN